MNVFKKKLQKNDSLNSWKKDSGSFIRKPAKGWIHPDYLIENSCVTYETRYIGLVKVLESVKTIPFEQRGTLVREAIIRCCDASKLFEGRKRKKSIVDPVINSRLGGICLDHSGFLTSTTFSKSYIKTYVLHTGENIYDHNIQCISFASIGENDYKTLIGYISKDATVERACFVFDCKGDIADDIILTIGQAFELKYKEFLNSNTNIQPVLTRFTDPVVDKSECGTSDQPATSFDRGTSQYAELFGDENGLNSSIQSAPGYHSLQRNDNIHATNISPADSNLSFSPCPLYDGRDVSFVAVYDNPISSTAAVENIPLACSKGNEVSAKVEVQDDDYDNNLHFNLSVEDEEATSSMCHDIDSKTGIDLLNEAWFHGKISRKVAERCIKCDGDFLVRESTTSMDQFVLSGMRDGVYRHILLIDPEGKVTTKDQTFNNVPELIHFHRSKEIPIYSGTSEVYLKREIRNTAI